MFVGRDAELQDLLGRLSGPSPQFLRIFGRRRVGKTELVLRLLEKHPGVYFNADEADRVVQLETLSMQMASQMAGTARRYASWDDFLDHLQESKQPLVVIDEFQHLLESGSGFASRLQDRWDRLWQRSGPSILICGSSIGMMQRVASPRTGPLYGRFTATLHLKPMRYGEARNFYPKLSEEERVVRYAIFGGTPYYHTFSVGRSLEDAVQRSLLSASGELLNEPHQLLREELNAPMRYTAILYEIGRGANSIRDLESKLQVHHGALSPYLSTLTDTMDLLRPEEPIGGKRRGLRYALSDPFFRFYYRFIFPNRGIIESRNGPLVWEDIQRNLDGFVGRIFEDVVKDALLRHMGGKVKGHKADYRQLGSWWNRSGQEVDILGMGPRTVWVGEVKWRSRPMGRPDVEHLLSKIPLLPMTAGKEIVPFVVSREGVTEEGVRALGKAGGFHLTMEDLQGLFERDSRERKPRPT